MIEEPFVVESVGILSAMVVLFSFLNSNAYYALKIV